MASLDEKQFSYELLNAVSREFSSKEPSDETAAKAEKAYNLIRSFMDRCTTLKGSENYDKQVISSDLARACAAIPVESPEMAAKLIKTTSDLFEMRSDGATAQFQLDTFAKQGKFLEDKKVAATYLDATSKSFSKLDTPYDSCISALSKYESIITNHPEMAPQIVGVVSTLQDKFPNNPSYKECTDNILRTVPQKKLEEKFVSRSDGSWKPNVSSQDKAFVGYETTFPGGERPNTASPRPNFVGYETTFPGVERPNTSPSRPSFLERAIKEYFMETIYLLSLQKR